MLHTKKQQGLMMSLKKSNHFSVMTSKTQMTVSTNILEAYIKQYIIDIGMGGGDIDIEYILKDKMLLGKVIDAIMKRHVRIANKK